MASARLARDAIGCIIPPVVMFLAVVAHEDTSIPLLAPSTRNTVVFQSFAMLCSVANFWFSLISVNDFGLTRPIWPSFPRSLPASDPEPTTPSMYSSYDMPCLFNRSRSSSLASKSWSTVNSKRLSINVVPSFLLKESGFAFFNEAAIAMRASNFSGFRIGIAILSTPIDKSSKSISSTFWPALFVLSVVL